MKRVKKLHIPTDKEFDYGCYDDNDIAIITVGYKWNGLFYERKGSNWIYIVEEVY